MNFNFISLTQKFRNIIGNKVLMPEKLIIFDNKLIVKDNILTYINQN